MSEELVPQVEMAADASVVVDADLLQVLQKLGSRELAELSQVIAELQAEVVLSTDPAELRALREAPDAAVYEWRSIDGEARLTVPEAGPGDWLARGLTSQMSAVPTRWRHDVVPALFTLVADLADAARSRQRRRVLGRVAVGGGVAALLWLGLQAAAPQTSRRRMRELRSTADEGSLRSWR